jgi:hypothetical protein
VNWTQHFEHKICVKIRGSHGNVATETNLLPLCGWASIFPSFKGLVSLRSGLKSIELFDPKRQYELLKRWELLTQQHCATSQLNLRVLDLFPY